MLSPPAKNSVLFPDFPSATPRTEDKLHGKIYRSVCSDTKNSNVGNCSKITIRFSTTPFNPTETTNANFFQRCILPDYLAPYVNLHASREHRAYEIIKNSLSKNFHNLQPQFLPYRSIPPKNRATNYPNYLNKKLSFRSDRIVSLILNRRIEFP